MRQRMIGNALVVFGLLVLVTGLMTNRATAADDLPKYKDKVVRIEGARAHDSGTNRTTFTFKAEFSEQVSHITVVSCPEGAAFVSASGPDRVNVRPYENDPSINHVGQKFEPGQSGTYTVVFSGNVSGADFVVKNGDGHKHYSVGTGCSGTPVTTSSSATTATSAQESTTTTAAASTTTTAQETTTTTAAASTTTTVPAETTTTTAATSTTTTVPVEPTTTTVPAETTTTTAAATTTTTEPPTTTTTGLLPDILGETTTTTSASTTSSSATTATSGPPDSTTTTLDSTVLGSQLERPAPSLQPAPAVEGATETAPDAAIANTGSNTGDYLLLAGLALLLGGLAVRFGQAEGAGTR